MQQFELTLKNEKYRLYDKFAVFIFLLNAAGIIFACYLIAQGGLKSSAGPFILFFLFLAAILYFASSKKTKKEYYFLYATLFTALYWLLIGFWWIGLLILLMAVLYTFSKKVLVVKFNEDHIEYPSLPIQNIKWNQTNNVILKDGLLTIDLKNNKVIQQPVDEEKIVVNEQDFNDFCQQQLNTAKA